MRTDVVVLLAPAFDQHFRFLERVEKLALEQLVLQLAIEAFDVAVLPGRARFDVERLDADLLEPVADGVRCKLRAVVAADVGGHAAVHK